MIEFEIPGHCVGREEPQSGKHGWYTPKKTKSYYEWVRLCYIRKYRNLIDDEHYWKIHIIIYVYGKKHPDNANVLKGIEDALQGYLYKNDKEIIDDHAQRVYITDKSKERVMVYAQALEKIKK